LSSAMRRPGIDLLQRNAGTDLSRLKLISQ